MAFGALDTATLVTTSAGLPIDIRASNANVTVVGTGTFVIQEDGAALTALQLIDNVVHVEDVAHVTGDSGVMVLGVENEDQAALTAGDKDYTPIAVTPEGNVIVKQEGNITVNAHAVTNAGTFVVQEDGAALTALQLIDNVVYNEDVGHSAADPGLAVYAIRDDALAANAAVNADLDYTPFRVNNDGALWTQPSAGNLGGCKGFFSNDLDESEEDIATGACTVYGIYAWNATAAPLWLQIFNTNTVTVGTTAPTFNYIIPANADSDGAGVVVPIPVQGQAFATALTMAITTGVGTNNGAPGANDAGVYVLYQD